MNEMGEIEDVTEINDALVRDGGLISDVIPMKAINQNS
jgi:hypothetical protein